MKTLFALLTVISVSACAQDGDQRCTKFLSGVAERDVYQLDLLKQSNYPQVAPIQAAVARHKLDVPCKALDSGQGEFSVAAGRSGQPWILFVRPGELEYQGEVLDGVVGDLVFYAPDGSPSRQHKNAVRLFGFEGFGLSRTAKISAATIDFCDQEFELFKYAASGDVIGLLEQPQLSACMALSD